MYVSPYALNETETDSCEEDEPQNVPSPPFTLHSWNVSGAARAFLPQGVRSVIAPSLAFSKDISAELAKEQASEGISVALTKEQASEAAKDLPLSQWEPLTLPTYAYVPLSEWEPLTLPFYTLTLSYVTYSAFKPVRVLSLLSLFNNVPYYATKPASVLSPFSLVVYVLGDPYVPVPCCMLVTNNAPGSSYFKDPLYSPCPFVGNRAKLRPFPFVGYRAKFLQPLTLLFIAKKTLESRFC